MISRFASDWSRFSGVAGVERERLEKGARVPLDTLSMYHYITRSQQLLHPECF